LETPDSVTITQLPPDIFPQINKSGKIHTWMTFMLKIENAHPITENDLLINCIKHFILHIKSFVNKMNIIKRKLHFKA